MQLHAIKASRPKWATRPTSPGTGTSSRSTTWPWRRGFTGYVHKSIYVIAPSIGRVPNCLMIYLKKRLCMYCVSKKMVQVLGICLGAHFVTHVVHMQNCSNFPMC